eukprot:TRINITY_DN46121_c0_g1_i1.p1 TRINITY_DN46121_c0_g1~~TRINITY_DN46121_c0_g1_i1.p1  ORF type:complete len:322 (+),score=42.49 TRINITY_DN46121_c0_g1_i1:109-1074(+)
MRPISFAMPRRWTRAVACTASSISSADVSVFSAAPIKKEAPNQLAVTDVCGRELLPGFVHLPGVLSSASQQALLDLAFQVAGESRAQGRSGGWYRHEGGERWSLNDGTKARFWDSISHFPPGFCELGQGLARIAARDSKQLERPAADFDPRVGALNYYTSQGRMGWHADDYNFAKKERPIVMANLGDAADFGYKMRKSDPDQSVRLESGDVIVFGGQARDLVHAVLRVHPNTSPAELQSAHPAAGEIGRVSITWRDVGPEDGLTFNSDERLGLLITENTLPRYLPKRTSASRSFACRGCGACEIIDSQYCQKACWDAWQKE